MRARRSPTWAALAGALLVPAIASAQPVPPQAAAPRAPSVRVQLARGGIDRTFVWPAAGATFAPPNPAGSVDLGAQALRAYGAAAARAFAAPAERPTELEVRVALRAADLEWDADGWKAVVDHEVVVVAAPGREIGRWRVGGAWPVEGLGSGAIPRAFDRAADVAAARWEAALPGSADAVAALGAAGVAAPLPRVAPEPRPVARPSPPTGPRAAWVFHLDAGLGFLRLQDAALRDRTDAGFGRALYAGIAGRVVTARAAYVGSGGSGGDTLALDLGAVLRVAPAVELHGGGGVYAASGGAGTSAFVGVQFAGLLIPGGRRFRFGVEGRRWAGTGSREDPPRDMIALTLGLEVPLGSSARGE